MTKSRRNFLKVGLLATAFAALPVKKAFMQSNGGDGPPALDDPLAAYSKSAFASYLNSVFQIHTADGTVDVNLVRIDDLPSRPNGECFSLIFRGGSEALKQDTYELDHAALGTFQLLLVPAGTSENGAQQYAATINRLSAAEYANISVPTRIRH
jgi:hypothetical protein